MTESLSSRLEKSLSAAQQHISGIRTGRANPDLLNSISVSYYGSMVPIQQVAAVSVPESAMIQLNVFDRSAVIEVEKAIQKSDLGLTPNTDGSTIRLRLPELTEERRKELVKVVKKTIEESKVAMRNIRRDALDSLKAQEKAGELTEDDVKRDTADVQKDVDAFIAKLDKLAEAKEQEIMTV